MKKTLYEDTARGELRAEANRLNRIAATASTTMQAGAGRRAPKKKSGKVRANKTIKPKSKKSARRPLNLEPTGNLTRAHLPAGWDHVGRWGRLVQNPFSGDEGVKCPFNFNPAPSLMSTTCTTVNYESGLPVSSGQSRQLAIWPGHYIMDNIAVTAGPAGTGSAYPAQMDEVAYHQSNLLVAGVEYSVGPGPAVAANGTTILGCATVVSAGVPNVLNGVVVPTTAGGTPQLWDNPYPVTATTAVGSHMRWKMIGMGIKIRNITPAANRGGSIVSVQPAFQINVADYATQAKFSQHPSFKNWGDGTDEIVIPWIPRPRDLAYWHGNNSLSAPATNSYNISISGPGILVWFNAPAQDQQYEFTQVAHWEIAGTAVQILSQPTVSSGVNDSQVKAALGSHAESGPTAHGFMSTLKEVVQTGKAVVQKAERVGRFAAKLA